MKLELANYSDVIAARLGNIRESEIRTTSVDGIVDTGAAHLVIPGSTARALGVGEIRKATARYADNHTAQRSVVGDVWLRLCDRESVFSAVVEPNRDTALVGAIVLEELDLLADCGTQKLHPRDPDTIVTEIE
jgi:predicted aspartyl protease